MSLLTLLINLMHPWWIKSMNFFLLLLLNPKDTHDMNRRMWCHQPMEGNDIINSDVPRDSPTSEQHRAPESVPAERDTHRWTCDPTDTETLELNNICRILTAEAKMIITLVFSAAKNGFKSVISIFCCCVSVGNIHLAINCNNPEMWSDHHQSVWSHMKKQNKLRLNPEELCLKTLQETSCKAPEKLCWSAPRTKPALNTKMLTTNVDFI